MITLLLAAAGESNTIVAPSDVLRFSEWLSVVVGLVSLAISVIAFFAALMFYLKGQELQERAATALTKIEEKSENIQTHFGGMFDKTLEAAIARKEDVSEEFDSLQSRLEQTAETLTRKFAEEIKGIGQGQKEEISRLVKGQFAKVSEELRAAKSTLTDLTPEDARREQLVRFGSSKRMLGVLREKSPISLDELLSRTRIPLNNFSHRIRSFQDVGFAIVDRSKTPPTAAITTLGREYADRVVPRG